MPNYRLVEDLATVANVMRERNWGEIPVLGGWPMPSKDGVTRLYMNLGLSIWVDIPDDAILVGSDVVGGTSTAYWIRPNVELPFYSPKHDGKPFLAQRILETLATEEVREQAEHAAHPGGQSHTWKHTRWTYCH
jgi:hypothetical protein